MNQLQAIVVSSDHVLINTITVPTRHGMVDVNLSIYSSRRPRITATALVGTPNEPGWRLKDGAGEKRRQVAEDVANAMGLTLRSINIQALYSRLQAYPDGSIKDRNTGGYYL